MIGNFKKTFFNYAIFFTIFLIFPCIQSWGEYMTDEELMKKLTPLQYLVTQKNATEKAFHNEYWDNEEPGIYVDIVSGEPLFSSTDKFDSGTGWPSFKAPIDSRNIVLKKDISLFSIRTEVRSKKANSHLGHLFKDGPEPTGLRYCINSASLRFIPLRDLEKEGYDRYKYLFGIGEKVKIATFAGGCFWCMESTFDKVEGILKTTNGYMGGTVKNPTYEQVSSGKTGHVECVQITFDSSVITYEKLLDVFWKSINPTDNKGQFSDRGSQYKPLIFYHNEDQKRIAEDSKKELQSRKVFSDPIVVEIKPASSFYPAEEYHQDYYRKNPLKYRMYRFFSGRDQFIKKIWEQ